MKGRGDKVYNVSSLSIFHITAMHITIKIMRLMVYITAGPRYMRTRFTSSLMRFIKSPVLFFL